MSENPYKPPKSVDVASDKIAPAVLSKAAAMFARHLSLLLVIGLGLTFVAPPLEKRLIEFEVKLPAPTLLVLTLSRVLVNYWYLALILLPLYVLFLVGVQSADRRFAGLLIVWSLLFWLTGFAFLIGMVFALALPFLQVISNLSR